MSNTATIHAEIREDVGKGASRRLRHTNKIPAVLYGAGKDPVALTLEHDPIFHMSEKEAFYASILEIKVGDGRRQNVVVQDLQRHPYKPRITHLDFLRVSDDQILRHRIPLHFTGEEKSPAGKTSGVVISHQITEVEVAALPKDLPEYLEVDLSTIDLGDVVLLSQIELPEGVELPILQQDDEQDYTVASAAHVKTAAVEEETEAPEAGAVPTVADEAAADADDAGDETAE